MNKKNLFLFTIILYIEIYIYFLNIFVKSSTTVYQISSFIPEEVNGLISNDLSHETFSEVLN